MQGVTFAVVACLAALANLSAATPGGCPPASTTTAWSTTTCTSTSTKTATVTAQPTCGTSNTFTYRATFDDLVSGNPANPTLQNVNTYDSIYWQAFAYAEYTQNTPGNIPNSQPNAGAFSNATQTIPGQAGMYSDYAGSTINNFTLYQFYYGCLMQSATDETSTPTSCNVTINGYNKGNQLVATQTFPFVATGLIQQMSLALVSPAFSQVYYVTFAHQQDLVSDLLVIVQVDSVLYTVYGSGILPGNS